MMNLFQVAMLLAIVKHTKSFSSSIHRPSQLFILRQQSHSNSHSNSHHHLLPSTSIPNRQMSLLKTSLSLQKPQEENKLQDKTYGGDYAGQSATFSPLTGKLIPVPEHYVPSSMVEWGQIPSCLEVIVSEDNVHGHDNDKDDCDDCVERCTVQIMPEVGCGLDNLDTMKTKERIPLFENIKEIPAIGVHVGSVYLQDKNRIECIFTKDNSLHGNGNDTDNNTNTNTVTRTRVGINFFPNKLQLKSPIHIISEQKTSDTSSKGTIADGGGLDARTVMKLVGRDNINKPFSDGKGIDLDEVMVSSWVVHDIDSNGDRNDIVDRDAKHWNDGADTTTLSLPGNVIVRYGGTPLSLEVSLVMNHQCDADADDTNAQKPIQRIVIKREFMDTHEQDHDTTIDNFVSSTVNYYWEERKVV